MIADDRRPYCDLRSYGNQPLLILHGEGKSYCFTVSCVPENMFRYL